MISCSLFYSRERMSTQLHGGEGGKAGWLNTVHLEQLEIHADALLLNTQLQSKPLGHATGTNFDTA